MAHPDSEFILVHPLEPVETMQRFEKWMQHITLLPWFTIDDTSGFYEGLGDVTAEHGPIPVVIGEDDYFGRRNNMPVQLVEPTFKLALFHVALLELVEDTGRIVDRTIVGAKYRPHVTKRQKRELETGSEVVIDELTVVEKGRVDTPFEGCKTVVSRFILGRD